MEPEKSSGDLSHFPKTDAERSVLKETLKTLKKEYTELIVEMYNAGVPESLIHKGTRINGRLYRMSQRFMELSTN